MPERVQLRRTRGWRKPEGAIVVARPSRWGNPCRVWTGRAPGSDRGWWAEAPWWGMAVEQDDLPTARAVAASALRRHLQAHRDGHAACGEVCEFYPSEAEIRAELAGHDLCCWCPPEHECHADVLLAIARGDAT